MDYFVNPFRRFASEIDYVLYVGIDQQLKWREDSQILYISSTSKEHDLKLAMGNKKFNPLLTEAKTPFIKLTLTSRQTIMH